MIISTNSNNNLMFSIITKKHRMLMKLKLKNGSQTYAVISVEYYINHFANHCLFIPIYIYIFKYQCIYIFKYLINVILRFLMFIFIHLPTKRRVIRLPHPASIRRVNIVSQLVIERKYTVERHWAFITRGRKVRIIISYVASWARRRPIRKYRTRWIDHWGISLDRMASGRSFRQSWPSLPNLHS